MEKILKKWTKFVRGGARFLIDAACDITVLIEKKNSE